MLWNEVISPARQRYFRIIIIIITYTWGQKKIIIIIKGKGKCGLLPQHYGHRMRRCCNHLILLSLIFRPAALCWWAQKKQKIIIIILAVNMRKLSKKFPIFTNSFSVLSIHCVARQPEDQVQAFCTSALHRGVAPCDSKAFLSIMRSRPCFSSLCVTYNLRKTIAIPTFGPCITKYFACRWWQVVGFFSRKKIKYQQRLIPLLTSLNKKLIRRWYSERELF